MYVFIYMYVYIHVIRMLVCVCVCVCVYSVCIYTHARTHTHTHTQIHTSMHWGQDGAMVHMTPGVQLEAGTDNLGQRYLTPEIVITERTSGRDFFLIFCFTDNLGPRYLTPEMVINLWARGVAFSSGPPPPPCRNLTRHPRRFIL